MSVPPRIEERFEDIRRTRRLRWTIGGVLLTVVGLLFFYALWSVEMFHTDLKLGAFLDALKAYFPFLVFPELVFTIGGTTIVIPYVLIDPSGFVEYWSFIDNRNLIWGGIGGDLPVFGQASITLAMAFAGTIMGFPLALLFSVLGSGRVMPFPFNFLFRGIMSSIRAIPALVWALIFVPLGGIGPVTATLAIGVDTIGNLGRLFTDELEEIEDGPIEAMETTGASHPQTIVFGMLSQVTTPFIAWSLYIFEINVRVAVALGIIGGGGLGEVLEVQIGLFRFTNAMATILVILMLILTVEIFSQRTRAYLRADEEPMGIVQLLKGFPQRMAESLAK